MRKWYPSPCTLHPGPPAWAWVTPLWRRCAGSCSTPPRSRRSVCAHALRARRRISTSPKRSLSPARLGEFNQHFPDILPLKQANECLGRLLDTLDDRLLPFDLAGGNLGAHIGIELRLTIEM